MKQKNGIRIAFDAKRAFANMTGLGNYSRLVIGTMAAMYPHNHYLLMTPRATTNERINPILMRENVEVVEPHGAVGRHVPALWRTFSLTADLARHEVDLYHGLSNEIPLTAGHAPCATVVTIHDLIWRRVPKDYAAIDRHLYELKYRTSARLATRVIAISERTKADMVSDWGIDPAKIDVVYQGCDPVFSLAIDYDKRQKVKEKYQLPSRYIVAVGTVQSRKNQLLAVKAMAGIDPDVHLYIVGGTSDEAYLAQVRDAAEAPGVAGRVHFLQGVPFDDLPALYAGAEFSAYTSRYEGFGLPLIESLSTGTPVIGCTGSCLEEAGGPGGIYVDPDDVQAYVDAARSILEKRYLHDRLAADGKRYIARFNTRAFAEGLMKTYNKAILAHVLKDE